MDPNPNSFPILSYVMSRLNSSKSRSSSYDNYDIEQPQIQSQPQPQLHRLNPHSVELIEQRMSPSLFASMASTVTDISQTRSILRNLGDRPDHEAVDAAKLRLADIDSTLASHLADVVRSSRPDGTDLNAWRSIMAEKEDQIRAKAEREKIPYRAVVQLDEMHEAYGRLLKEAEEKLVRIYDGEGGEESRDEEQARGGEEVNEEIVGILQAGAAVDRVELKGRGLRLLPEAFGRMRGLVSLDLSNNQLETISDSIAGLELLQELRVSNNLLVSLPDSIGMLLNLKILDVSGNKLKALPDSISKCRSLLELDASYNSLGFLPTNIGYELKSLRKLVVHLNKLRSLPTSVCEMTNLRILDVHFNELHGLPYSIGKLINLESLNLSSNFSDLRELPPTFGDLLNLRELDLSNNQIHALPDSFGRLDKLTKLNLDQNPLFLPPAEIVNQGVEAIKEYMAKRWLDILLEEEQKSQAQETPTKAGWLTRSTSMLSSVVTGISGYLISEDKSPRDPYLDREL